MISTVILTKNEAQDLPACLESLCWCDDCHVLDSGSDDLTRAIADAAGAQVALHPFEGFGRQRNHALDALPFAHPWVLFLDADERTTPEFVATMKQAVAGRAGKRRDSTAARSSSSTASGSGSVTRFRSGSSASSAGAAPAS